MGGVARVHRLSRACPDCGAVTGSSTLNYRVLIMSHKPGGFMVPKRCRQVQSSRLPTTTAPRTPSRSRTTQRLLVSFDGGPLSPTSGAALLSIWSGPHSYQMTPIRYQTI